jgi:predicted glycosyltransferase involved in capsule biosynthesis
MNSLGYHVIHSNLDTQDYNLNNMQASKDIVNKALDSGVKSKNNYIVLMHDIHEATVDQLIKHTIDKVKDKGYKCILPIPLPSYKNIY